MNFVVHPGQMLGVIGANGAGKSTLLRLLGGIGRPTTGRIIVKGRLGALLDLGGGFLRDLTGRENATLAGVVAGLLRSEIDERLPDIVRFAELEDFIDSPLRTYSSGMQMRLAFAVAVHTDADVLLVDEFLSVGDLAFQRKCHDRIKAMRERGCAVVMVTHDLGQVRALCDRALWLRGGRVAALGPPDEVGALYESETAEATLLRTAGGASSTTPTGIELVPLKNRFGSLEAQIEAVDLRPSTVVVSGGSLEVEIDVRSERLVRSPLMVVSITNEQGAVCVDTNTQLAGIELPDLEGRTRVTLKIPRLELAAGRYFVNAGIFEAHWAHAYDYHWHAYPFTMEGASDHKGPLAPPCRWTCNPGNPGALS